MNITPEQIPDEVVEAALAAFNEFPCPKPGSITRCSNDDQMKSALAAALLVLLVQEGYRIDWHDATYRGKQTVSSTPCSAEDGRSTPLYSIRTPETPNDHP